MILKAAAMLGLKLEPQHLLQQRGLRSPSRCRDRGMGAECDGNATWPYSVGQSESVSILAGRLRICFALRSFVVLVLRKIEKDEPFTW